MWPGVAFGAATQSTGEIVFNTSLTGYQEILTDPSYAGQIVTMTSPHIGNTGITPEDDESARVWAAGLVVRSLSPLASNWRSRQSLPDYLRERGIPGLEEVDTRALVRHIRTKGAMRSALSTQPVPADELVALARSAPDMNGLDLVKDVTCDEPYQWAEAQDWWPAGRDERTEAAYHVVAYDYGIKHNILRLLAARGCRITIVPANSTAEAVLALRPDGIFLSNGPGDPAAVTYAIDAVRELVGQKPLFGICLGHQILGLALGASSYKLKFGHRGGNQPVQVVDSGAVQISSHNHGFAIDPATLPPGVVMSHVNLNDNCCEGLIAEGAQAFSVQYHPESSPGPHDSDQLFDRFVAMMAADSSR